MIRFIEFCLDGPEGDFVIIGKSLGAIKRNVITILKDLLGDCFQAYLGKSEAQLFDRKIHLIGANDERAEHKIRGSTFSGAYVDEVSIIPLSVFQMLKSRVSKANGKIFGTTNPDSPFHWFKKDFLDRSHELDVKYWEFSLEDNPSLDKTFIENIKKEYQGLWYQRFIEGKWVLAEGAVYDFFDESIHVINHPPGPALYYIVGIDYGTTNPCVFSLIGYNPSFYPNMWLEKEYYYDSKVKNRQKTDSEYVDDLVKFKEGYYVKNVYVDPSAASFKAEMRKAGVEGIKDAVNDVLDGIRFQSQLLSNGTYKICSVCANAIKEYSTYLWDPKSSQKGVDEPLKQNDHSMDSQRYALFTHFFKSMNSKMSEEEADNMQRMYTKKSYY